ncbi:MAG: hypothetical protein AAFY29_21570 [Pseudomonadota bacterium]
MKFADPLRAASLSAPLFLWSLSGYAEEAAGEIAAQGDETNLRRALQECRAEPGEGERLACYDLLAKKNAPPDYAGKLGFRTPLFSVGAPTRLRFRSQGVIFVLYVLNERGEVLQNLHLGGGGEGDYVIRNPGRYSLQIDGSARWQLWLEPLEEFASGYEESL